MNIFQNIATVPKELNWPKDKIENKVYELLNLMGLDPDIYAKRRPSDLSGGQRQRVGVARAMAADSSVMLMDEPFGAVDPITRGRLQDEFLNMQEKLKKTIVFVTHDINEALKMGTKIAVMKDGHLVQYCTPDELLSRPKNEFVEDLIGGDSTLKRLNLILAEEIMTDPLIKVNTSSTIKEVRDKIGLKPGSRIYCTDNNEKIIGYLPQVELDNDGKVSDSVQTLNTTILRYNRISEALSQMLNFGESSICVVDDNNILQGVVYLQDIIDAAKK
jgi:osmoprotectant transport system ATP-binding protein